MDNGTFRLRCFPDGKEATAEIPAEPDASPAGPHNQQEPHCRCGPAAAYDPTDEYQVPRGPLQIRKALKELRPIGASSKTVHQMLHAWKELRNPNELQAYTP